MICNSSPGNWQKLIQRVLCPLLGFPLLFCFSCLVYPCSLYLSLFLSLLSLHRTTTDISAFAYALTKICFSKVFVSRTPEEILHCVLQNACCHFISSGLSLALPCVLLLPPPTSPPPPPFFILKRQKQKKIHGETKKNTWRNNTEL